MLNWSEGQRNDRLTLCLQRGNRPEKHVFTMSLRGKLTSYCQLKISLSPFWRFWVGLAQDLFSFAALLLWLLALLLLLWRLIWVLHRSLRSPEILFFPDPSGGHVRHLCHLLRGSRKRMWIAMFTLTDDVLTQEILNAWERKVDVKVWDV